jgi:NTP pyrophosphatase (non-canonical NTP hydrolase)
MQQTNEVLSEVKKERQKQEAKWGQQNHEPAQWLMILGEEVGEANKAALETKFKYESADKDYSNYRMELIQVAAVAVAMIESLDRKTGVK